MISVKYPPSSFFRPPPCAACRVSHAPSGFTEWLRVFGKTSWNHQSFFAGLWPELQSCTLSLPIYPEMSDAMIEYISQQIESAFVPAYV
jgi:hypothetical protein